MPDKPIHVLLVEDSVGDARLLREALAETGAGRFRVVHVPSLREALGALSSAPSCEVILLDLSLPDSAGLETVERMHAAASSLPIIVLTGLDDEQLGLEAIRRGAQDYLLKGQADGRLVARAIRHAVERKGLELERERLLDALGRARDELELRVRERTADLHRTVTRLEAEVRARALAEEGARVSEMRLRLLLEQVPAIIWTTDAELRVTSSYGVGPAAVALPPRARSAKPAPAGRAPEPQALAPAAHRRALAGESLSYEVHLSDRTYHCHVEPLRSADGAIAGCIGVALDITEHKRLEEQHARVREQLHQAHKLDMIGRLAAGLSHDFGNVLATVAGYTSLARRHLPDDHPACRSLDAIDEAAQQARGMTHALLSFGGRVRMAKRPLNLRAAVEESVRLLHHALPASVELAVSLPEPPLWIEADPVQVQQVLLNLALNARDAMPGGGRLEISLAPASEAQAREVKSRPGVSPAAACLAVRDTGEGMSAEILPHVFEPFFTTKKRDRGTGLGLSIVHGIVTDLGGRIRVASAAGEGTTFTLVLPCVAPSPAAGPEGSSAAKREGLIALVGGDRHVRGVMAAALSSLGYDVVHADDPEALLAEHEMCRDRLRLVVLPAEVLKNGGEWFGRLRGAEGLLPAVVIADEADPVAEGTLPRGVRVLRRPFQMTEFRDLVCRVLER